MYRKCLILICALCMVMASAGVSLVFADTLVFSDTFESGMGNWSNTTANDNKDWARISGATPSGGTGPSSAQSGLYYMYLETSYGYAFTAGDTAILLGPSISSPNITVTFYYYMYGENIGTLSLDVLSNGAWINDVWSVSGQQQTSSTEAYRQADVDLSGYSVSQVRIRATAAGGSKGDMAIDSIEIWSAPTDPVAPYFYENPLLKSDAYSETPYSETLSGDANDGNGDPLTFTKLSGPDWLTIGASGTLSGTPSSTDGGINSFEVEVSDGLLTGQTTLTIYVNPNGAPILISRSDFESGMGEWSNTSSGDDYDWIRDSGGTPTSGTGPSAGADGSAYYLYFETSTGYAYYSGNTAFLMGPAIIDSGIQLKFQYHMYGTNIGSLAVDVLSGGSWLTDVWSIGGEQQNSSSDEYSSVLLNLRTINVSQIRFRATAMGGHLGDIAVDNIEIWASPPAPSAPSFLADPVVKAKAFANIPYSDSLAGDATDVNGDPITFSKMSGPAWLSINAEGLLSGSPTRSDIGDNVFEVHVSDGELSSTGTVIIPVTGEAQPESFSFTDFETGLGDWTNVTAGDSIDWLRDSGGTPSSGTGPSTGAEGSAYYVYFETSSGYAYYAGNSAILESPAIDQKNIRLLFQYHMYGANTGTLSVDVLADGTWINDIWTILEQQQASSSDAYISADINLGSYNVEKIRFRAVAAGGYLGDIAIDNIDIMGSPEIITPIEFISNPLTKSDAVQLIPYSDTLHLDVSDPGNESLVFSKTSGPAWLNVAADGTLSGTPDTSDTGSNSFVVEVSNGSSSDTTTLIINVIGDSDSDGITDNLDACPDTPAGETVDPDGCSDSQKDSDNDGISDNLDDCPDTPNGETVDLLGCSYSQRDDDNDGVPNGIDTCPDTPVMETPDENGCSYSQLDDDNDGIANGADACPGTPEGEAIDETGCSDSQKDSDNDTVTDDIDACPNTPAGEAADENGCADSQKDTDNDTVTDDIDTCPNTPAGEAVDANGCADSQKDSDNDTVTDDIDTCPNTPAGEAVDANGCADSQKDSDNDTVTDDIDTCPNTPAGEAVDANGCADSQKDSDNDTVTDDMDTCPGTPAGETVDVNGCADSQKDSDNDTVTDDSDTCPNTQAGEPVDENGCADYQKDSDNDTVTDDIDTCPNTPAGETADANGCADSQKDTDNDTVTDDIDECPDTPEGEMANLLGCSYSQLDDDGDGYPNGIDACPETPIIETPDENGCSYSQLDDDNDGIANGADACPGTLEGEAIDETGCSDSQKDSDNDTVTDDIDACPNTPAGEAADENGCADSQKDTDNDTVTDDIDTCPNTPAGEAVDANGCADSQKDSDNDTVTDDIDTCPNTPAGEAVDANGCADSQKDTDNDTVTDDIDTCPNTPAGETADANGCSDSQKDNDYDGVSDALDTCPNTATGESVDINGCSDVQIAHRWTTLSSGYGHTLAIDDDGALYAWGFNGFGQLGNGLTDETSPLPEQIGTDTDWKTVSAGYDYSLAIKEDGTLYAWGRNVEGQLGIGSNAMQTSPVQVGFDNDWVSVSAGQYHTLALKADGTLFAWGKNKYYQLGDGTDTDSNIPIQIGTDNTWASVSAGFEHSLALRKDGTLFAWGSNRDGQIGNGSTQTATTPVQVGAGIRWIDIIAGPYHSFAITADRILYGWGSNVSMQLGDTSEMTITYPLMITSDNDWMSVSTSSSHAIAVKMNGDLYAWGNNYDGNLGDGTFDSQISPILIDNHSEWKCISAGSSFSVARKADGSYYTWGLNEVGQLGIGVTGRKLTPNRVDLGNAWAKIVSYEFKSVAIKSDGSLYICGGFEYGSLESKTQTMTRIGTDTDWVDIAAGEGHILALKSDGSLYAWGDNYSGQLGDGTNSPQPEPVRIGLDSDWADIDAGKRFSVGLKNDGTLYAWGENEYGQLGDGTGLPQNYPVQVGSDNDWIKVSAGSEHVLAIKDDGTLYAWGYNEFRQLGDNSTTNALSPIQIGNDTDWADVSAGDAYSMAIKTDGSLYGWGNNDFGQIGNGTTNFNSVPGRVGIDDDWKTVVAGYHHTMALKTDGSLFAWGSIPYLGDGTTTSSESPIHITADADWSLNIAVGNEHSLAIKQNGSLYSWGSNTFGQLGDGSAWRKTPTLISLVPVDSDQDGVIDPLDICADTQAGEAVDAYGCSDSQRDTDEDSVTDDIDECPDTPAGEAVDTTGCSDSQRDDDNDGILNGFDSCPNTPADETADTNGCSDSQKDTDNDGVTDDLDECSNTPEGEIPDLTGCSYSQRDDDNDGVSNGVDWCRNTPDGETVDDNGCSDSQKNRDLSLNASISGSNFINPQTSFTMYGHVWNISPDQNPVYNIEVRIPIPDGFTPTNVGCNCGNSSTSGFNTWYFYYKIPVLEYYSGVTVEAVMTAPEEPGDYLITGEIVSSHNDFDLSNNSMEITLSVNNPPQINVLSPSGGSDFEPDETIHFEATSSDVEDGDLSAQIQWHSNIDGAMGVGSDIQTSLSSGTHDIIVSIEDSNGAYSEMHLDILITGTPAHAMIINTLAGNGIQDFSGDGGPAIDASLNVPRMGATDVNGNIYIADKKNNRIRKVTPDGIITTKAGGGYYEVDRYNPRLATKVELNNPDQVVVSSAGELFIYEEGTGLILKIRTDGYILAVAGFSGEFYPSLTNVAMAIDDEDNIYIGSYSGDEIFKMTPSLQISVVAGTGGSGSISEGIPALNERVNEPLGVAVDHLGNIYYSELNKHRIRKIGTNGIVYTIAGSLDGEQGFSGDGGPAIDALFRYPRGLSIDEEGNLYICDTLNYRIRKIDTEGIIRTIAGNGIESPPISGSIASNTTIENIPYLNVSPDGYILLFSQNGHTVQKLTPLLE